MRIEAKLYDGFQGGRWRLKLWLIGLYPTARLKAAPIQSRASRPGVSVSEIRAPHGSIEIPSHDAAAVEFGRWRATGLLYLSRFVENR